MLALELKKGPASIIPIPRSLTTIRSVEIGLNCGSRRRSPVQGQVQAQALVQIWHLLRIGKQLKIVVPVPIS